MLKSDVKNYLDFFRKVSIYYSVPKFLLDNNELMKNLSDFALNKAFKNSQVVEKESLIYFICFGIIKEAYD